MLTPAHLLLLFKKKIGNSVSFDQIENDDLSIAYKAGNEGIRNLILMTIGSYLMDGPQGCCTYIPDERWPRRPNRRSGPYRSRPSTTVRRRCNPTGFSLCRPPKQKIEKK